MSPSFRSFSTENAEKKNVCVTGLLPKHISISPLVSRIHQIQWQCCKNTFISPLVVRLSWSTRHQMAHDTSPQSYHLVQVTKLNDTLYFSPVIPSASSTTNLTAPELLSSHTVCCMHTMARHIVFLQSRIICSKHTMAHCTSLQSHLTEVCNYLAYYSLYSICWMHNIWLNSSWWRGHDDSYKAY